MAEGKAAKKDPTEYVILERVEGQLTRPATGREETEGAPAPEQIVAWRPVTEPVDPDKPRGKRQVKVVATDRGDEVAVELHTGKGEGALVGQWKAVARRSWTGTVVVDPPEQVYADRRRTVED